MKIQTSFQAEVRAITGTPYTADNGSKGTSYKVGLELDNGEMGMLPCVKEFVDKYDKGEIKKGDFCYVYAEYDSNYKSLKVFNATPIK